MFLQCPGSACICLALIYLVFVVPAWPLLIIIFLILQSFLAHQQNTTPNRSNYVDEFHPEI